MNLFEDVHHIRKTEQHPGRLYLFCVVLYYSYSFIKFVAQISLYMQKGSATDINRLL